MSLPLVVFLDLLCIAVGLNVFAWFHHVRDAYFPRETAEVDPVVLITPSPAPTPVPESTPTPVPEDDEPERVYSGPIGAPMFPLRSPTWRGKGCPAMSRISIFPI